MSAASAGACAIRSHSSALNWLWWSSRTATRGIGGKRVVSRRRSAGNPREWSNASREPRTFRRSSFSACGRSSSRSRRALEGPRTWLRRAESCAGRSMSMSSRTTSSRSPCSTRARWPRPARARAVRRASDRARRAQQGRGRISRRSPRCRRSRGTCTARCSGLARARRRTATAASALGADGSLEGEPIELDLAPLYTLLRERLDALNVEGAVEMGDELWLLQRGTASTGRTSSSRSCAEVIESLSRDRTLAPRAPPRPRLRPRGAARHRAHLQRRERAGQRTAVFTASAEDTSASARDGAIVGLVGANDRLRRRGGAAAHDRPQVQGRGRSTGFETG